MAGRIEFGKSYYVATAEGLVRTWSLMPVSARGAVKHWECHGTMLDKDGGEVRSIYRLATKKSLIFGLDDELKARKAVFKLKLTTEGK